MGLVLGLDFGTTYSMLSMKDDKTDEIIPCKYKGNNAKELIWDSIVYIDKNENMKYGPEARNQAMGSGCFYSGFKMLLNETRKEELERDHYTEKYTPKEITKRFLNEILKKCLKNYTETKIDRLVIGVPDVWDKQANKSERDNPLYRNRSTLISIVKELQYVDNVELYSEPELASAYYLHHYKKTMGNAPINGHLLLIDYGGGTLDVAICRIDSSNDKNVGVLKTFGEGWNEKGKKGDAGFAYMRRVIELAVSKAGLDANERIIRKLVYDLENSLVQINEEKEEELHFIFGMGDINGVITGQFCDAEFDAFVYDLEHEISVTYGILAEAFNDIIDPVLNCSDLDENGQPKGILERAKKYMDENGINYSMNKENTNFKIQLVGGFSSFYLVEKSVEKAFGGDDDDIRLVGGFKNMSDKNYAVSYGAALVASEEINITRKAKYSLGVCGFFSPVDTLTKEIRAYWATKMEDLIVPGRVYLVNMVVSGEGNVEPKIWKGNGIDFFAYCDDPDQSTTRIQALKPTDAYKERLMLDDNKSDYVFGISFDKSMIISLYKWKVHDSREFLKKYKEYVNSCQTDLTFGDSLLEHPEMFNVEFESCDCLANIFTLTDSQLI